MYTFPGQPGDTLMNTFFLYLSMLRYYVVKFAETINNITIIAQSNYNLLRWLLRRGSPSIPNRVVIAQMVLQLCGRVCRRSLKTLH
jgi:hypothetical protein